MCSYSSFAFYFASFALRSYCIEHPKAHLSNLLPSASGNSDTSRVYRSTNRLSSSMGGSAPPIHQRRLLRKDAMPEEKSATAKQFKEKTSALPCYPKALWDRDKKRYSWYGSCIWQSDTITKDSNSVMNSIVHSPNPLNIGANVNFKPWFQPGNPGKCELLAGSTCSSDQVLAMDNQSNDVEYTHKNNRGAADTVLPNIVYYCCDRYLSTDIPCATNFGETSACCGQDYLTSEHESEDYICPMDKPVCVGYKDTEAGPNLGICEKPNVAFASTDVLDSSTLPKITSRVLDTGGPFKAIVTMKTAASGAQSILDVMQGGYGFNVSIVNSAVQFEMAKSSGSSDSVTHDAVTGDNNWHTIIACYNGSAIYLWVDGVQGPIVQGSFVPMSTKLLQIGENFTGEIKNILVIRDPPCLFAGTYDVAHPYGDNATWTIINNQVKSTASSNVSYLMLVPAGHEWYAKCPGDPCYKLVPAIYPLDGFEDYLVMDGNEMKGYHYNSTTAPYTEYVALRKQTSSACTQAIYVMEPPGYNASDTLTFPTTDIPCDTEKRHILLNKSLTECQAACTAYGDWCWGVYGRMDPANPDEKGTSCYTCPHGTPHAKNSQGYPHWVKQASTSVPTPAPSQSPLSAVLTPLSTTVMVSAYRGRVSKCCQGFALVSGDCEGPPYDIYTSSACSLAVRFMANIHPSFQYMGSSKFISQPRGCFVDSMSETALFNDLEYDVDSLTFYEKLLCATKRTCATYDCQKHGKRHLPYSDHYENPTEDLCCESKSEAETSGQHDCFVKKACRESTNFTDAQVCECSLMHKKTDICDEWYKCISVQSPIASVWFKELVVMSTEPKFVTPQSILKAGYVQPNETETNCVDPSNLTQIENLECDCVDNLHKACAGEDDRQLCVHAKTCESPMICESWKLTHDCENAKFQVASADDDQSFLQQFGDEDSVGADQAALHARASASADLQELEEALTRKGGCGTR